MRCDIISIPIKSSANPPISKLRRRDMRIRTTCLIALLALVWQSLAHAESWLIMPDGSGAAPTIQAGVDSAAVGDTVLLADGTFTGTGNRDISYNGKAIVVRSVSGNPSLCVIDVNAAAPDFHIGFFFTNGEGPGSILESVTITRGDANTSDGGAITCTAASPTIRDCVMSDNDAYYGGAMRVQSGAWPTVEDCVFRDNTAYGDGDISAMFGSVTITRCSFFGNSGLAEGAGAVWCRRGSVVADECTFAGNYSKFDGSGIQILDNGTATITGCTFFGNSATEGSAVSVWSGSGPVSIENTIMAFSTKGDAVNVWEGCVEISCCNIYGNAGGDWTECLAGELGVNGNISVNPLFCDPDTENFGLAALSDCLPGNNTCGVLIGAHGQGCETPTGIGDENSARAPALFIYNRPNPFSRATRISVNMDEKALGRLAVYDVKGRFVKLIVEGVLDEGLQEFSWDGTDSSGLPAASGVYFCTLSVGGRVRASEKMVLTR
jgi:hypothetical protein